MPEKKSVGTPVPSWTPRALPNPSALSGRWCRLEPLALEHAEPLLDQFHDARTVDLPAVRALRDAHGFPVGPGDSDQRSENGCVEVGGIVLASTLQRSAAATEAMSLMARHVWRNAGVYQGRNRDTAWFSITDTDWAHLRPVFEEWLAPQTFHDGAQRRRLSAATASVRRDLDHSARMLRL